ncbi:MAG: glycosyltransferase family 4 protein [Candidatus Methanoperedens sp.]|nr:glycosyltransferase family 4 protein [Candidatus Methanoperedens sp.]MCZ7396174.1 glycosyltransferase family 4 protein [Candidatus Methanoperedens sp.]
MKVAMLCQYPLHKMWGGPAVYIDRLAYHLSCIKDVDLHVITIGEEGKQFRRGNLNIHIVKIPKVLRVPFFIPFTTLILKHKVLKLDPDIVHAAQGTLPPYSLVAVLLKGRYPVLLTILGIISKEAEYNTNIGYRIGTFFNQPIEKYVISRIPNIIVEAPSIRDLICKNTNSNIYINPVGIDYDKIEDMHKYKGESNFDILYIGRLEKIKGVDILINSLYTVIKLIPGIKLYIVGSGSQAKNLKALARKLNLENNVKFLGFISEMEKYQKFKACKLVVVPSRWDCQPFALFDAAASGVPVIASDMSNPGIVDNGKTGFIFESENIEDLANKIITLLKNDKLREEMGNAAKEKAKQYDWNKIAERTVEIYREIIAKAKTKVMQH